MPDAQYTRDASAGSREDGSAGLEAQAKALMQRGRELASEGDDLGAADAALSSALDCFEAVAAEGELSDAALVRPMSLFCACL